MTFIGNVVFSTILSLDVLNILAKAKKVTFLNEIQTVNLSVNL